MKQRIIKKVAENIMSEDKDKTVDELVAEAPGGLTDVANTMRKTMTSRQQVEMEDNPVEVRSPEKAADDTTVKPDLEKILADDFMKSASKEDLDKLRNLKESDILTSDMIVALDLQLPTFLDVRPKDPVYVLHWVNRKYSGEDGTRIDKFRGIGFVNARQEDIDGPLSDKMQIDNGAIVSGDLLLMKINKAILFGIYKANLLRANKIHNPKNVHKEAMEAGKKELRTQLRQAGVNPNLYEGKLGMFIPDAKELGEL